MQGFASFFRPKSLFSSRRWRPLVAGTPEGSAAVPQNPARNSRTLGLTGDGGLTAASLDLGNRNQPPAPLAVVVRAQQRKWFLADSCDGVGRLSVGQKEGRSKSGIARHRASGYHSQAYAACRQKSSRELRDPGRGDAPIIGYYPYVHMEAVAMTNYQLAKLIQMAGGLRSRKRIQKTVHLLQCAGCDFGLDYRLHYYGPYSSTLAERLDLLSRNGILVESEQATEVGTQYNYELDAHALAGLEAYEATPDGTSAKAEMEPFLALLGELNQTKPRVLELASTIAAFYEPDRDWDAAQARAAEFKAESTDSPMMREARQLAEKVIGSRNAQH